MKKIIILLSVLALGIQSCDVLDKEPMDAIGTEQFFSTANAAALEQYCNYFYPRLIKGHGDSQSYNFGMMEEDFKSDNLLPWIKNDISFGHQTIPNSKTNTEWSWENIRGCNDFLINYMRSPEIESVKNRYAGEILFFKSMDYFNKVKAYGNVPWYSKPLTPGDPELYKARDSRILVMDSILNSINRAIEYLPKKTKVYRISKDAALALKARICLFEGTYRRYHNIEGDVKFLEEAYAAAGELMKPEYGYALYKGSAPSKAYYELFIQADYNTNPEVILSKEYDPIKGRGNNLTRQIVVGEDPIGMSKDCADDYLCANTGLPISRCACHKNVGFIDELKNRDPRLLQTIPTPEAGNFTYYLEGKKPAIGKVLRNNTTSSFGATSTGYAIVKFYNPTEFTASHHQGSTDAPIFRYAEILLIRAEAGAELGKDPELDLTVNALRNRVGFTHALTTGPVNDPKLEKEYPVIKGANVNLIREIRRERRIELFGEGYRYADLMRWAAGHNLAHLKTGFVPDPALYTADEIKLLTDEMGTDNTGALDVYGKRVQKPAVFEDPKHYLAPIPINELSLNPNLKPQNAGW